MPILEVVIAIGIIVLLVRTVPRLIDDRQRRRAEKEARRLVEERRRIALHTAMESRDLVEKLLTDRQFAEELHRRLGETLDRDKNKEE